MNEESERLEAIDRELLAIGRPVLSLAPGCARARLPSELATVLLLPEDPPRLRAAFAEGLGRVVSAMLEAFPRNLLWDLDLLAATLLRCAREAADPVGELRTRAVEIARLQDVFGREGPILFSYIHDFIYGFDWARWVARDPDARREIGPYDPQFIARMQRRGAELVDAIASESDPEYPPLSGDSPRNPFGFSRKPDDELRLFRHLAEQGVIPVWAWRTDATPRWDLPFEELRTQAARDLGLSID